MTFLAILTAIGLALNVALVIVTLRSLSDLRKRMELREELDGDWHISMLARVRALECKLRRPDARTIPASDAGKEKPQ